MDKVISLIRIATLFLLGTVAACLLFGEEQAADNASWFICFIFDKALAAGILWCVVRLFKHWSKTDRWFIAYNKMCDDTIDIKANP